MENSFDFLIIGSGVVGLSIAWQLLEKDQSISIAIIEKEKSFGQHTSGKNSGILHAGIYYKPESLKAKVCIKGAKRLIEFCKNEKLDIMKCGKVISPQKKEFDQQIDFLYKRGITNGAEVKIIDKKEFYQMESIIKNKINDMWDEVKNDPNPAFVDAEKFVFSNSKQ